MGKGEIRNVEWNNIECRMFLGLKSIINFKPENIRHFTFAHSLFFYNSIPIFFISIDAFKLLQMPSFNL
jgi:hypothetical protein